MEKKNATAQHKAVPMHYIKKRLILRGRIKVGKRPSDRHANVRRMTARCPVTYIVKNL